MTSTENSKEVTAQSVIGQGSRLCISGLTAAATASVRQVLLELGAEATSFRPGADGIILPDNASGSDRAEALAQGYTVFTVSELIRIARGAEEDRAAIEIGEKTLRILDIEIPCGSESPVLDSNRFKHLCLDRDGSVIIADTETNTVRRYDPKTGKITRIAGTGKNGAAGVGGDPLACELARPHGVTVAPDGKLIITDSYNNRVLRIVP